MKKTLLSLLLAALLIQGTLAQKLDAGPQVLTIHSDLDDTEQPYALYLPKNYNEMNAYPLVIMLHGAGSNHRLAMKRVFGKSNLEGETDVEASRYFPAFKQVDYIVAAPFARGTAGYQGVAEQDVMQVLEDVKKRFTIDEDRIYLTGLSMGGGGTLWVGLTRPDIWAAIAPVCPAPPQGTDLLAGNALNYPVKFFQGGADPVVPAAGTRNFLDQMKKAGVNADYVEYPGVLHDSWVPAYADASIFDWFDEYTKNPHPQRVQFASEQLKYDKAYWFRFEEINPGKLGSFQGTIDPETNGIAITIENSDAFSLDLEDHPMVDRSKPILVKINGSSQEMAISPNEGLNFMKKNGNWTLGTFAKKEGLEKKGGLEGPVFDAFTQRHVYVYGTQGNPSEEELARRQAVAFQAANWSAYRGEFLGRVMFFPRVISDREVRPSDLEESNLILFGDAQTNTMIASMKEILPMELNAQDEDHGLLYIYPQGQNYVVINSGLSWWSNLKETGYPFVSLTHRVLPDFKDYILFKGSIEEPLAEGYFQNDWTLSDEAKANLKKSGNIQLK